MEGALEMYKGEIGLLRPQEKYFSLQISPNEHQQDTFSQGSFYHCSWKRVSSVAAYDKTDITKNTEEPHPKSSKSNFGTLHELLAECNWSWCV